MKNDDKTKNIVTNYNSMIVSGRATDSDKNLIPEFTAYSTNKQ